VDRTARVGQVWTGSTVTEGYATTSEYYDRNGRLSQVVEPPGGQTANYTYDSSNRLTQVSASGGGVTQTRSFVYDGRGFLLSETQPERGTSVNYSAYDSRGHFGRKTDGVNDLSYLYDGAERLTTVYYSFTAPSCTPGGTNCLKTFTYDTGNFNGLSNGKLVQAQRYNFPVLSGGQHVELLTTSNYYGGVDGRLSQRTIALAPDGDTNPTSHESFVQSWIYNDLGEVIQESYPACGPQFQGCAGAPARVVSNIYDAGRLIAVSGVTGTVPGQSQNVGITYWPSGLVSQVAHRNGVLFSAANDPNGMVRPSSLSASGPSGAGLWSTGAYHYDGSGNVTQIGGSYFLYDNLSRLVDAHNLATDPLAGGSAFQTFSYDPFGNLKSYSGTVGVNTPTDAQSNHLTGGAYDAAGNLRTWNGAVYDFDPFNQLSHYRNGGQEWLYMYDADDERVWSFEIDVWPAHRFDRWTLRGQDGRVRRSYEVNDWVWTSWNGGSSWEDMIYRGPVLLAGLLSTGAQRHMDVDHLGTVRLITNFVGNPNAYHLYYPYGQEATYFGQDGERFKFTGHERDLASPASDADDLDNMHARHFSILTGRFLSVEPANGDLHRPQSWNLYEYALDSPLEYSDPSGLDRRPYDSLPRGFAEFLWGSYDFLSGTFNALGSNLLFGAGRFEINRSPYRGGQFFGDVVSVPLGLELVVLGGSGEVAGLALDSTVAGAALGVPANVVSGVVMADGVVAAGLGFNHTMAAAKSSSGGGDKAEHTPTSHPDEFGPVRGSSAKVNKSTGEIWERDTTHGNHWEVYKNKKQWENRKRDRDVWMDGNFKSWKND
jgi:RHS repeat-associated protein